jgi:hypothetical protein
MIPAMAYRAPGLASLLLFLFMACGFTACGTSPGAGRCADGLQRECPCPDGSMGQQTCRDGAFDACGCTLPRCGDGRCNGSETCLDCRDDCGVCPKCAGAPSCTDAAGVPTMPQPRADLDVGFPAPDGGAPLPLPAGDCKAPQLRLRIEKVEVKKGGGQIYCILSGTDGATSEVAITTKTKDLGDNQSHAFDPTISLFWGQQALRATTNNLTLTYNCWKVGSDGWAKALEAMSDTAVKAGGVAGPYGWAFGAGAVAASAAAAAAQAASGDDHRFNAQQTIPREHLLDLTNGRTWRIRQSGDCGLFCDWDWTLTIQSWGCADAAGTPG